VLVDLDGGMSLGEPVRVASERQALISRFGAMPNEAIAFKFPYQIRFAIPILVAVHPIIDRRVPGFDGIRPVSRVRLRFQSGESKEDSCRCKRKLLVRPRPPTTLCWNSRA